jgi:branched-chain amino acid transport system substrate-binding protein
MKLTRSTKITGVVATAALISTLGACAGGSAGAGADTLKIGAVRPASGSLAQYGSHFDSGINLAVKQINDAGGLTIDGRKVKVEVKYCDSAAEAAQAATCGRKLATEQNVPVELVSLSLEAFPIMAVNATGKNPFVVIAGSASNKLVTQGNPLVARYWFNSYQYMPGFTKLLSRLLTEQKDDKQTVAILQSEDEYGKAWNETFTQNWKALGKTVTRTATFATNSTDVYPQITALLKDQPAVIALPGACPTIIPGLKQARELGFTGRFIFGASCTPAELIKAVGEKAIAGSIFEGTQWDAGTPAVAKIKDEFKKTSGTEPTILDGVAYAFAQWAMASAQKANSTTDAEKIRAAMAETLKSADWNILGLHKLQKNGETSAPIYPRLFKSAADIVNFTGDN